MREDNEKSMIGQMASGVSLMIAVLSIFLCIYCVLTVGHNGASLQLQARLFAFSAIASLSAWKIIG